MLKLRLTIAFAIFMTTYTLAQRANEIIGKYHLPNNLDIEISENNGKYYGEIIALNGFEDGQTRDVNNPEESKHNDSLIGKVIIIDLEYDNKKNVWVNGSMYGPEKGMVFNLKVTEIKQNEIVVVASKYFFWRTLKWIKIQPVQGG